MGVSFWKPTTPNTTQVTPRATFLGKSIEKALIVCEQLAFRVGIGYTHGQTNTDLGWITFDLAAARRLARKRKFRGRHPSHGLSVVIGGVETVQQSEQIAQVMRTATGNHYQLHADALKASNRVKFMDIVIKIMELDIARQELYDA